MTKKTFKGKVMQSITLHSRSNCTYAKPFVGSRTPAIWEDQFGGLD